MKISDLKNYEVVGSSPVGTSLQPTQNQKKPLANKISDFVGAGGITDQFGAELARFRAPTEQKNLVEFPSTKKVIGSAVQTGAMLIPGVGAGGRFLTKAAVGAGTGFTLDVGSSLQQDKSIPESLTPGAGTAVGAAFPVAGAVVGVGKNVLGRLFKGLGAGLSGVSTKTIDSILDNPQTAQKATDIIKKAGNDALLESNARIIINGVSSIRKEARLAFGEGLESLSKEDITPAVFRSNTQAFLDKYGVSKSGVVRSFNKVEFSDPKNIKTASDLVNRLNNGDLDGKTLRKLADDIDSAKFKTATSDERLSFNAFIKDLSGSLKNAINSSTDKLNDINSKFSQDMQLVKATEDIFGKVNFKNLPEVVKASKKLETIFSQKGLQPKIVDDFLKRIGVSPEDFKTTEAVRSISDKTTGANTTGLSFGELVQQATSAVFTPAMVRNLSIATGLADEVVKDSLAPILLQMNPLARTTLINALLQENQ